MGAGPVAFTSASASTIRGTAGRSTYGPLVSFGSFRMPAWGTSADASWRFEYVEVTATDDALRVPPPPSK